MLYDAGGRLQENMMFSGAHIMLYSKDAEADRAFFRDKLGLSHVDAGEGWLIFRLPPAEMGIHPAGEGGSSAELYLMCDDIEATVARLGASGVPANALQDMGWGVATQITLPSGAPLGLYQPRHARPA